VVVAGSVVTVNKSLMVIGIPSIAKKSRNVASVSSVTARTDTLEGIGGGLKMKQNRQALESRQWAKEFGKPEALKRTKGKCELCKVWCAYIAEAHHVDPAHKGGSGSEDNLIILCPNCHSIVEAFKKSTVNDPGFHEWIRNTYGDEFYNAAGRAAGFAHEDTE